MSKNDKIKIANAIKDYHLSMREVSLAAGLGATYVRDMLGRDHSPSVDKLRAVRVAIETLTNGEVSFAENFPVTTSIAAVMGIACEGIYREELKNVLPKTKVPIVPNDKFPAHAQYALEVRDNSLKGKIEHGEFAICVKVENYPGDLPSDCLVHVRRERSGLVETTIKQRLSVKGGETLINADGSSITPQQGDVVTVQGVVIGKWAAFI